MTKKLKVWVVALSAVIFAGTVAALVPAAPSARAQDAPVQPLTSAEQLTIALLQQIVAELVELNHNVQRLPAPEPMAR